MLAACDAASTGDQAGDGGPATTAAAATTAPPRALPPTPACDDVDDPTPAQTEGPYFTPVLEV